MIENLKTVQPNTIVDVIQKKTETKKEPFVFEIPDPKPTKQGESDDEDFHMLFKQ
jgi:hypothetical protein